MRLQSGSSEHYFFGVTAVCLCPACEIDPKNGLTMPVTALAYLRPFTAADFQGYFEWTRQTTEQFRGKRLWHCCHRKQLEKFLLCGQLSLRSRSGFDLPVIDTWTVKGVWVGM